MNPCLTTNQVIYIADEKAPHPPYLNCGFMRSWWDMNAISLGWKVTVALAGTEDELGEPGEPGEQCQPSEPGELGRTSESGEPWESGGPSGPSEPGESGEQGEPGWNVTMAVSGGEEERRSFSG